MVKDNRILIVGLGNPGKKYEKTRHNVGFRAIDEIASNFQFPASSFQSKFNAQIYEGEIGEKRVILAKPQTFMNLSGQSLSTLINYYKISPDNMWIINDDVDIPLGNIKISRESGSAGHKGVESIIKNLGTKDFIRFRIGIQPTKGKPNGVEKFVIKKFSKDEEKLLSTVIPKTVKAIETALNEDIEKAMNLYN